ncbi:MAG TPA: ATP-binding cassette domain-containing protein [Dehalococcoidales bacterium]|nr:ATP-binding cassette domain-containing protein [Dehalococcoidales bacterium]
MNAVEVKNVSKTYGSRKVVNAVSFSLGRQEILGLIGPNGAGKTTCIRMIMDVIKPDSGEVFLFGEKFNNNLKNQIGYLPEERGLYRQKSILQSMVYFAGLKGIRSDIALQQAEQWLVRVNLHTHKNKKVAELSLGMGQLVQTLVTLLHNPGVIILDEPFNGLDPVNVQLVKDIILEQKNQGKSIILSTHRMNDVEELCDRVFMINQGQNVLYGSLSEIKAGFRSRAVKLEYDGNLPEMKGMTVKTANNHRAEIVFESHLTHQQILEELVRQGVIINRFEIATPSLNEIFIQLAGGRK